MNNESLHLYARTILTAGINLQQGQNLIINSEPIHWELLNALVEEAYKMGARFVKVDSNHQRVLRSRVEHSEADYLDYMPPSFKAQYDAYVTEGWARVSIDGHEDPRLLKGINSERLSRVTKAQRLSSKGLLDAAMSNKIQWVVVGNPTPGWAAEVFHTEPTPQAAARLWDVLKPILRLDKANPVEAWKQHSKTLQQRSRWLNEHKFSYLHFTAPGTNLKVYLNNEAQWVGAEGESQSGVTFLPNIPTEEIFTTPNFALTEGRAQTTRPVTIMGAQVNGAWFEFRQGKVVDFGAKEGQDILRQYLAIDDGASMLGEVALVGADSPIYRSGEIFHSILFDENAACHIALGSGYLGTYPNSCGITANNSKTFGCNESLVHTDFMIGSEEMNVDGVNAQGKRQRIMENGLFVGI